jgi:hypothetical protein
MQSNGITPTPERPPRQSPHTPAGPTGAESAARNPRMPAAPEATSPTAPANPEAVSGEGTLAPDATPEEAIVPAAVSSDTAPGGDYDENSPVAEEGPSTPAVAAAPTSASPAGGRRLRRVDRALLQQVQVGCLLRHHAARSALSLTAHALHLRARVQSPRDFTRSVSTSSNTTQRLLARRLCALNALDTRKLCGIASSTNGCKHV